MMLKKEVYWSCGTNIKKWKILYRSSIDGFTANVFHGKCDGKCDGTLTIIKTKDNYVFGGYTKVAWDQSESYKNDPEAFIFSFKNNSNKPVKINNVDGTNAIYCYPGYGPTFGDGHDIQIANASNTNTTSFSNFSYRYKLDGYDNGSDESNTFLAGSYNFQVSEIEVFQNIS
jgi:hypothetical protein